MQSLDYLAAPTRLAQLIHLAGRHATTATVGGAWQGRHAVDDGWIVGDEPPTTPSAIVLGDLNIATDSDEYHRAREALADFVDPADGIAHAAPPTKDGGRIDHIWVTADLGSRAGAVWVDEAAAGSDHQPTWLELAT